jgi:hypothetical protein
MLDEALYFSINQGLSRPICDDWRLPSFDWSKIKRMEPIIERSVIINQNNRRLGSLVCSRVKQSSVIHCSVITLILWTFEKPYPAYLIEVLLLFINRSSLFPSLFFCLDLLVPIFDDWTVRDEWTVKDQALNLWLGEELNHKIKKDGVWSSQSNSFAYLIPSPLVPISWSLISLWLFKEDELTVKDEDSEL